MNRTLWLRAQGVPQRYIIENTWYNPRRFEVNPHHCVVCNRPWRPDKPEYVATYGHTRLAEQPYLSSEWHSPTLGITASTGFAPGMAQIRHICTEHGDRWAELPDCHTGEMVQMRDPPSTVERAWRDARYWVGSVGALLRLLVQECAERAYVWFRLKRHSPRRS